MKKMKFLSIIFAIFALTLVGCNTEPDDGENNGGDTGETGGGGNDNGDTGTGGGETTTTSWSKDELALIEEYAYGVDVPYLKLEGNGELYYDEDYGCLSMTGASVTSTDLQKYANLFEGYGWTLLSDFDESGYYLFEIEVEYESSIRYVDASIYALNTDYEYVESGTFWLDLIDPYYYSWPEEIINSLLSVFLPNTTSSIPVVDSSLIQFDTTYLDYGLLAAYCYDLNDSYIQTYRDDLEKAGYTVSNQVDEYGYYVAISALGDIEIDFTYDDDYESFDVYIYFLGLEDDGDTGDNTGGNDQNQTKEGWSAAELAVIDEYLYGKEIPFTYLSGNGDLYYDEDYGCVSLTGATVSATQLKEFADAFEDAGWTLVSNYSEDYMYSYLIPVVDNDEAKYLEADIYALDSEGYLAESGTFWLDIYDPFYYDWPGELVNEFLSLFIEGNTTQVPTVETNLVSVDASYASYGYLSIYVLDVTQETETLYRSVLTNLGYSVASEVDDFGVYVAISPNGDFEVDFVYDQENEIFFVQIIIYFDESGDSGEDSGNTGSDTATGEEGVDEQGNLTASINFTSLANSTNFSAQKVGNVNFSVAATGGNPAVYLENGQALRVYYGDSFIISVPENYEIISIEITLSSETGEKILTADSLSWKGGTAAVDGHVITVTADSGVQEVACDIEASKGHIRIVSILVTYKPVA